MQPVRDPAGISDDMSSWMGSPFTVRSFQVAPLVLSKATFHRLPNYRLTN